MRPRLVLLLSLLALAVAALVGLMDLAFGVIFGTALRGLDVAFAVSTAATRTPAGETFFGALTHLGDTYVVAAMAVVAGIGLWLLRRRAAAVYVAGAVATGALVNTTMKAVFDRTRPPAEFAVIALPSSPSFPSGHAVAAFVLFGTLAVVVLVDIGLRWDGIGLAVLFAVVGVLVGYSRLYLGVHWFTDVLASWLLGTAWLAAWTAALLVADGLSSRRARDPSGPKTSPRSRAGTRPS